MDNYSKGLASFGIPLLGSGGYPRTGFLGLGPQNFPGGATKGSNIFFVNNALGNAADSKGQGIDPARPFKTLNFALTQTINNNGDMVFVGPGHVETIAAAAALTFPTATAAGVTVVFCGNEADRAQVNFTATAGTVTIPAGSVTIVGMRVLNSIDALVSGMSITGSDVKLIDCEWLDGSATNTLIGIVTTNAAKRLSILGYRYYEDKVGGGTQKTEHIRIVGGDHHRFQDMHITGDFSTAPWNNITTLTTELLFQNCSFDNLNATPHVAIAILTTSTGQALDVVLTIASGSTWLTASNKLTFDGASVAMVPGGVYAHPNG